MGVCPKVPGKLISEASKLTRSCSRCPLRPSHWLSLVGWTTVRNTMAHVETPISSFWLKQSLSLELSTSQLLLGPPFSAEALRGSFPSVTPLSFLSHYSVHHRQKHREFPLWATRVCTLALPCTGGENLSKSLKLDLILRFLIHKKKNNGPYKAHPAGLLPGSNQIIYINKGRCNYHHCVCMTHSILSP